jgi:hypothetical protein
MDDYIFLIIAVVISIFAAVKKNKKKEQAVAPKRQSEPPQHFLFDQLLGENRREEPADEFDFREWPSTEPERKPEAQPAAVLPQPKPYDIPRQEFKSHLPGKQKTGLQISVKKAVAEEEEQPAEEGEEQPGYLEDFSLRKAVVYAEILKPKFESEQTTRY